MGQEVSDHFWETCVLQVLRKVQKDHDTTEEDRNMISALFERASGSWVALASGDTNHWDLLRRCCTVYLKRKMKRDKHDKG